MNRASGDDGIPVELFQILKDDAVKVLHSKCQQIWKTQQWPQDWKRSVFIPIPKKVNAKELSNYYTIEFISHASKLMFKILQASLEQDMNCELVDVQTEFRKFREPEIKLPTSIGLSKKQESSIKISTSASMTLPKLLIMWVTKKCGKFFKRWELEHLTCLLRNLYAGHEATVRTRHGKTDGFKIGKGVGQSRIWSPCLFNLYAEYIMRNTGLDEAQH